MLRTRIVLASFLVLTCAACTGGDATSGPPASPTSSTSVASTPSSTVPPELAGYSEDERLAYDEALAAYADYLAESDKIYARGETTVAAKRFYQRYAIDWSTAWGNLAVVANNRVTITGEARALWTRPVSIGLTPDAGDVVVIRRCVDESQRVVRQNGKRMAQPQFKEPHVYTVRLEERPEEDWWRAGTAKLGRPC
jgi:hypothetical protein